MIFVDRDRDMAGWYARIWVLAAPLEAADGFSVGTAACGGTVVTVWNSRNVELREISVCDAASRFVPRVLNLGY